MAENERPSKNKILNKRTKKLLFKLTLTILGFLLLLALAYGEIKSLFNLIPQNVGKVTGNLDYVDEKTGQTIKVLGYSEDNPKKWILTQDAVDRIRYILQEEYNINLKATKFEGELDGYMDKESEEAILIRDQYIRSMIIAEKMSELPNLEYSELD